MAMSPDDMVPSGPSSSGQQAVIAYLQSKGIPVNAGTIRQALEQNARDPGSMDVNPQTLGPTVLNLRNAGIEDASPMPVRGDGGNTSAAPSGSVSATPPKFYSDSAASQPLPVGPRVTPPVRDAGGGGGDDRSALLGLLPGAGGLGAAILTHMMLNRGVPVVPSPVPAPALAGPRLSTTGPGFAPEYGAGGTVPSGPGFDPEYGPARPATPPTQPAPGPRAPVEPVVPPAAPTAPTGAGFSPEYGSANPVSAAIDKAVPADAPVAPRAKAKGRIPKIPRTPRLRL